MNRVKHLITSGCSFTYDISTPSWATFLNQELKNQWEKLQYNNYGKVSAGNGYISRSLIYGVSQAMKTWPSNELLVGVMWSGSSRHDVFQYRTDVHNFTTRHTNNPIGFVENNKNWIIMNHHWKDQYSTNYYKNYHDEIGSRITTLEHILRTQWFLKNHNIKYFMSVFAPSSLPYEEEKNDPNIKHLYDLVDWNTFLPVKSCMEWCVNESGLTSGDDPQLDLWARHPSKEQHKKFTDTVIMPHLKNKGYVH